VKAAASKIADMANAIAPGAKKAIGQVGQSAVDGLTEQAKLQKLAEAKGLPPYKARVMAYQIATARPESKAVAEKLLASKDPGSVQALDQWAEIDSLLRTNTKAYTSQKEVQGWVDRLSHAKDQSEHDLIHTEISLDLIRREQVRDALDRMP
jgi:hypothetical protein